jgi:hypothetical protein
VSDDLKNISTKKTGPNSGDPSKDRWQHGADTADQMSEQNNNNKSAGDQDGKSHSTAEDDESQRKQKRPANAGRSSQRPDPTFEQGKPGHTENNNKQATQDPEHDKKAANTYEESGKAATQISNTESNLKPTILFVEVRDFAPRLHQLLT